jgi:hypothetical protein
VDLKAKALLDGNIPETEGVISYDSFQAIFSGEDVSAHPSPAPIFTIMLQDTAGMELTLYPLQTKLSDGLEELFNTLIFPGSFVVNFDGAVDDGTLKRPRTATYLPRQGCMKPISPMSVSA